MSIKVKFKNGQYDRYEFLKDGKHTHEWYDAKTGLMGAHGENTDKESKKIIGDKAKEMTNGHWLKTGGEDKK